MKTRHGAPAGWMIGVFAAVFTLAALAAPLVAQAPVVGIGIVIQLSAEGAPITDVMAGSPAERAGLRKGDVILAVDNSPVHGMSVDAVSSMIRGARGTSVKLIVSTAGKGRNLTIMRDVAIPAAGAAPAQAPAPAPPAAGQAPAQQPSKTPLTDMMTQMAAQQTAAPGDEAPQLVTWTEPTEHSFSVQIPQGWRVNGGLHRRSAVVALPYMQVQSPDGKVLVFAGDPGLMPREVPAPFLPTRREGTVYRLPTGDSAMVQRYQTGSQYARQHATWRQLCRNPQWVKDTDFPDLARGITASLVEPTAAIGATANASSGEASFVCDDAVGAVAATTLLMQNRMGGAKIWGIFAVAGFVSADGLRAMQARYVMDQMQATFKMDPTWQRNYDDALQRATGAAINMQNAQFAAQQAASRSASDHLSSMNHPNQGVNRSSSPRLANSSGNRDVCDAIGRCKNVTDNGTTRYIDHAGNVRDARPDGSPPDNTGVWSRMYP